MSVYLDITADRLTQDGFRVLHAGDDYPMQFTAMVDGAVLPLTGATLWLTIKEDEIQTDANAKLQLSSADPAQIEITDDVNGVFVVKFVSIGSKATTGLAGVWPYDIQVKKSDDTIMTLARGVIEFLGQITRATS